MDNISKIWEGWSNHLFPGKDMKEVIDKISEERLKICQGCEHFKKNVIGQHFCGVCKCPFPAKTKCLSCTCPLEEPLWKPVVAKEELEKIKNQI